MTTTNKTQQPATQAQPSYLQSVIPAARATVLEQAVIPAKKPRICELCGLDVDRRFRFRKYTCWFDGAGHLHCSPALEDDTAIVCDIINCPEEIKPVVGLTEREVYFSHYFKAKYVTLDKGGSDENVLLWSDKPHYINGRFVECPGATVQAYSSQEFFPSVSPGECMPVEPEKKDN